MQSVKEIASTFSRHIDSYDGHARIQRHAAVSLAEYIDQLAGTLPNGPVLEIGCGTGLMTMQVIKRFPQRRIIISDASPDMVSFCRTRLQLERAKTGNEIQFAAINGQSLEQPGTYALIVSSFTFQWFTDLCQGISNLLRCLKPGGMLVFSLPLEGSFPEWKQMCADAGVPCTSNQLPDPAALSACAWWHSYPCITRQEDLTLRYSSAIQFFHSLKELGADTQTSDVELFPGQLLRLVRHWDKHSPQGIDITYRVGYGHIIRSK